MKIAWYASFLSLHELVRSVGRNQEKQSQTIIQLSYNSVGTMHSDRRRYLGKQQIQTLPFER